MLLLQRTHGVLHVFITAAIVLVFLSLPLFFNAAAAVIGSTDTDRAHSESVISTALAAFTRDAKIDAATLAELLDYPLDVTHSPLDTQLYDVRTQCRELTMQLAAASEAQPATESSSDVAALLPQQTDTAALQRAAMHYCNKARYVRRVREQMRVTLHSELSRVQQARDELEQKRVDDTDPVAVADEGESRIALRGPQPIETRRASSLDLQTFFEAFAETARPVVLTSDNEDASPTHGDDAPVLGFATDGELAQFLAKCFGDTATTTSRRPSKRSNAVPLQINDPDCTPLLEHFHVPLFVVHNYLRRTNASLSAPYLPSLVHLPAIDSSSSSGGSSTAVPQATIMACPHGLHMFAVALSPFVQLHVNVFDQSARPFLQSPAIARGKAETTETAPGIQEVTLTVDARGDVLGNERRAFHRAPALTKSDRDDALLLFPPRYHAHITLTAGSALFVPGSQFAALQQMSDARDIDSSDSDSDSDSDAATLLRFCFVDASNFNAVKQEVALEALIDVPNNDDDASDASLLLRSLQSHAFDRTMARRPLRTDTSWHNFVTWPKATTMLRTHSDMRYVAVDAHGEPRVLSRRERLKQWQDDRRWHRRVEALTLPVSLPPVVVNVTRTSATLRFQDLYEPPKHDITAYGYNVRWHALVDDHEAPLPTTTSTSSSSSRTSEQESHAATTTDTTLHEMNVTRYDIVRSTLPSSLFGDDFDGNDIEVVVRGLRAETHYTFTVQIYVDATAGLASDASRVVTTSPCSAPTNVRSVPSLRLSSSTSTGADAACAALQWLDPIDDGGKPISVYLISARVIQTSDAVQALVGVHAATATAAHEKIVALDAARVRAVSGSSRSAWKTARVCALLPGAMHIVRVAAMNAVGVGHWSAASDAIVPPSRVQVATVTTARRPTPSTPATTGFPTIKGRGDPEFVSVPASLPLAEFARLVSLYGPDVVIATRSDTDWSERGTNPPQQQQDKQTDQTHRAPRVVLSDVFEKVVVELTHAANSNNNASTHAGLNGSHNSTGEQQRSLDVWAAHYSPRAFHVSSELVLAEPLDAATPLRNAAQVRDRVVVVARGAVPLAFKAHYAQQAGALGMIIADVDDTCRGRFDQLCVPGADQSRGEGFAAQDRHALWEANHIPVVLALQDTSQLLLSLVGGDKTSY